MQELSTMLVGLLVLTLVVSCSVPEAAQETVQDDVTAIADEPSTNLSLTPTAPLPTVTLTPTIDFFPTPIVCRTLVVEQPFQYGRMFWIGLEDQRCNTSPSFEPRTAEIWVAIFQTAIGGDWLVFLDEWDEDVDIESDPLQIPPEGLLQPVRGFGKVWREQLSDSERAALGWGTQPEISFEADYRYDAGGFVDTNGAYVPRPGRHTLRSLGNETFVFDEVSRSFDYAPAL